MPSTRKQRSISYTQEQVAAIADCQNAKHALSTKIALAAGLRAHELLTLRIEVERAADDQASAKEKFLPRTGILYTVIGKFGFAQQGRGWLCRQVLLPHSLADELETWRLAEPTDIVERGTRYSMLYAIGGGQRWSNSFSQASNVALGRSNGANGLRHTYAQERVGELQRSGLSNSDALTVVAQEMGSASPLSVAKKLV